MASSSLLLDTLRKQANVASKSVGDLTVGRKYQILRFTPKETKFGRAVLCSLADAEEGLIDVFLPKSVQMSDETANEYNDRADNKDLYFKFLGKNGRAFKFTSE